MQFYIYHHVVNSEAALKKSLRRPLRLIMLQLKNALADKDIFRHAYLDEYDSGSSASAQRIAKSETGSLTRQIIA